VRRRKFSKVSGELKADGDGSRKEENIGREMEL